MALYNNGYPATYQPYGYQYQAAQPSTSVIWVQGEAGAKSYLVAPNTSVALFDSEKQVVYIKSADGSGMPSMKILDYTIRDNGQNGPAVGVSAGDDKLAAYATKSDVETLYDRLKALQKGDIAELRGKVDALQDELDGLTIKKPARVKKEDDDRE